MIAHNMSPDCRTAVTHLYDYICHVEKVPRSVQAHVAKCGDCQARIARLKEELEQAGDADRTGPATCALAANLELHLAYIDKPVSCDVVKPFLPAQGDPNLEVRILTPITAHIYRCRSCARDLDSIQGLRLAGRQLHRLSQMLSESPPEDEESCVEAAPYIERIAGGDFGDVDAGVLRHVCVCRPCRGRLQEARERAVAEAASPGGQDEMFPCGDVSYRDLYEYCFPYGVDPLSDQYAQFRPALTDHIRNCPRCLLKMLELHRTVTAILERAPSEVVTCFRTDRAAVAEGVAVDSDDLHIRIELLPSQGTTDEEVQAPQVAQPPSRRRLPVRGYVARPAAIAAGILVLIVVIATVGNRTAKAVGIEQVYRALGRAGSVWFKVTAPDQAQPLQEIVISEELGIRLQITPQQQVLWDLGRGVMRSKNAATAQVNEQTLDSGTVAKLRRAMNAYAYLMPFENPSAVPKGVLWQEVTDQPEVGRIEGAVVFDLIWNDASGAAPVSRRWRGYLSAETMLPVRIELWERIGAQDYELSTVTTVEYPQPDVVKGFIRQTGLVN